MATARLKRIRKRKEEDRIYWNSAIRRCCLRGSLIGSTIPISQLDLFALTAEDVSYGKKRVKGRKNTENKTEQGDRRVFQKYMKRDENSCKHMAGERDKQERTWIKTKAACVYIHVAIFRARRTISEWPPTKKASSTSSTGRALTDPSR